VNILQAIITSGVVAAVVSSVASFLIIRWQLLKATDAAKGSARVVYLEIAQNIATLTASQHLRPIRLIVTRKAWDARFGDLAALLNELEIVRVAAPYLQLDAYAQVLHDDALGTLFMRLRGEDRQAIDRLAEAFRDAAVALRPHVWSGHRATAMEEAIAKIPKVPLPNRWRVLLDGVASLPLWPFLWAIAVLQAMSFIERIVKGKK